MLCFDIFAGFMEGIPLMSMVGWMLVANPKKQYMARLYVPKLSMFLKFSSK